MTTNGDVLAVRAAMYGVSGVGGFSAEIEDGENRIILKHKDDVVLDPAVIEDALHQAGSYSIV
ncbi:MAG: hypothetical protein ACTHW4_07780 [Actinomycetales bacterium]